MVLQCQFSVFANKSRVNLLTYENCRQLYLFQFYYLPLFLFSWVRKMFFRSFYYTLFCVLRILRQFLLCFNFLLYLQYWTLIICTFTISTGFLNKSDLEEAFINLKPIDFSIDFSYRLRILGHMVIGFKQVRMPI